MENRNVLITGASRGIGYELAKTFAKKNNHLILVARDQERLEVVEAELKKTAASVTLIPKDLTRPGAAEEVHQELVQRGIAVHILVNCAGVGLYGKFHAESLQRQHAMLQLNMVALTQLTHLVAQEMIDRKFGRILHVASLSSFLPTPFMSVYAATKAYVLSFSEALHSELKEHGDIAVTALCPGFTRTDFIAEAELDHMEVLLHKIALSPAKVARQGYKALEKRKPVVIVGVLNQWLYFMIRFMPRRWLQTIARHVFQDRTTY